MAHAHDPAAQVVHPHGRPAYAQVRAVRTVLMSAASTPALDQVVIRAETHEGGMFPEGFQVRDTSDGALIEVYRMAAGFCSAAHARRIAAAQKGDIVGLTGNQPELWRAAERRLGSQTVAEVRSPWEVYQGDGIRDHLYRTTEMAGSLDWDHLKHVWRVEKELIQGKTGKVERENRDDVTTLHRGRFKPEQILLVVRLDWAIERNGNWTMDVIWDEASPVWCGQG